MAKASVRPLGTAFRPFVERKRRHSGRTRALKPSVDMSLPGIGEDFSLLDTIIAELPELFYAEILPKLDFGATLNLAQVNKSYNDAVWSVDGVRSVEAKIAAYIDINPRLDWLPSTHVTPAPIYWAVWYGNVPAVKALLKSGVDVNKQVPPSNGTPLYYAAFRGHLSIVALLLDAGANAREPAWGISPIDAARAYRHEKVVELLKAAGA